MARLRGREAAAPKRSPHSAATAVDRRRGTAFGEPKAAVRRAAAGYKLTAQEPAIVGADKVPMAGQRQGASTSASARARHKHLGPEGHPVKAAERMGTVFMWVAASRDTANMILIRHLNGYVSAYAN